MKQASIITSVESRITVPQLSLANFYKKLPEASVRQKRKKSTNAFFAYFEEIDWSSAAAQVDGLVDINYIKDDHGINCLSIPVKSGFIFTCTKGRDEYYEVAWMTSLS